MVIFSFAQKTNFTPYGNRKKLVLLEITAEIKRQFKAFTFFNLFSLQKTHLKAHFIYLFFCSVYI